jgi:hypothetical protein
MIANRADVHTGTFDKTKPQRVGGGAHTKRCAGLADRQDVLERQIAHDFLKQRRLEIGETRLDVEIVIFIELVRIFNITVVVVVVAVAVAIVVVVNKLVIVININIATAMNIINIIAVAMPIIAIIIVIIVIIIVIIIIVIIIIIIIVIVTTPSPCVTSRRLAVCRGRHRRHVGVISHACDNCALKCVGGVADGAFGRPCRRLRACRG